MDLKGQVQIPNVWAAVDTGTVVAPDNVRSQMEGAAAFGASLALLSEITVTNGKVNQSNFSDYQLVRMGSAPRHTSVYIVESNALPAGVGEPGVPPFAPAFYNAIHFRSMCGRYVCAQKSATLVSAFGSAPD